MSPLPAAGLLAAALAWVLAAPTNTSPAGTSPAALSHQAQPLRPGGRVTTGGLQVLAPATWTGDGDLRPDHTTVQVSRVARADLE